MNCKICMCSNNKYLFKSKGFELFQCQNCNFVFVTPVPSDEIIDEIYQTEYFDKGKYVDDFATKMEYSRRLELIQNVSSKNSRILDFGCASGEFVSFVSDRFNIIGADISNDAIHLAKKKYSEIESNYIYINVLDTLQEKFDVIVLWDVIEHVKDPLETIQYLKKKLKKNGAIILSTPNIGAPVAKLFRSKWAFMTPPEHLCFFDKKSIFMLSKKLGGEVVEWHTKGKWVNIAFLFYKIKRIFPSLIPQWFIEFLKKYFNKTSLYIPTGDIQYSILKFKGDSV